MPKRSLFAKSLLLVLSLVALGLGGLWFFGMLPFLDSPFFKTIGVIDRKPPPPPVDLINDVLDPLNAPNFDSGRVDSRPDENGWRMNLSAAVTQIDSPAIAPDLDAKLLVLKPSYGDAVKANFSAYRGVREYYGATVLPSVNAIDGKAKQFDDGLYAALDQAYYRGLEGRLHSHVDLVKRLHDAVGAASPAAPFLAAALELAGVPSPASEAKQTLLAEFRTDSLASKPIGFYNWTKDLEHCFQFLRFLSKEFEFGELQGLRDVSAVLAKNAGLREDYQRAVAFYGKLTNPPICLAVDDLSDGADAAALQKRCRDRQVAHRTVAFFPRSTSRETVLFERLFPAGLPPNADLMRELIQRVRSGEIDLAPNPQSGWFDHQAFALETLLLPGKGEESNRLLLTAAYKRRMLEAFQALLTQRWETHVRQMDNVKSSKDLPRPPIPQGIKPRLRLEPCPTFYLRTARAYAFLEDFLTATVGLDGLRRLHGLKQGGERPLDLATELARIRELFYGLYLLSAEDVGMAPSLKAGEVADEAACRQRASEWLAVVWDDPDLAFDVRIAVPVAAVPGRSVTLWTVVGVRFAKLEAKYHSEHPPRLQREGDKDWEIPDASKLAPVNYLIPVADFAAVERPNAAVLTRSEFRALCDRAATKPEILQLLRQQ